MNTTSHEALEQAIDTCWLLFISITVLNMQIGFTMLEVGTVRAKNTMSIMMKNLLSACIAALAWLVLGDSVVEDGTNAVFQASPRSVLLLSRDPTSAAEMGNWFRNFAFLVTATTIVSGAVAERTALPAYLVVASVIPTIIYPTVARWVWNINGWLCVDNPNAFLGGMIDWSGSCVVHVTGGVIALVGAMVVGPRRGRYDYAGRIVAMPGSNAALQVLGTLVLWVGWYGFNAGGGRTLVGRAEQSSTAARVAVCTTLASASSGLFSCLLDKWLGTRTWSVSKTCNGILSGLVGITAGCASTQPQVSVAVGFIAAIVYLATARFVGAIAKIDDPLDAFAVHGAGGIWGTVAAALFACPTLRDGDVAGLAYGDARPLGAASVGLLATIGWASSLAAMLFFALKRVGVLRVHLKAELLGLDVTEHGATAIIPALVEGAQLGQSARRSRISLRVPWRRSGGSTSTYKVDEQHR